MIELKGKITVFKKSIKFNPDSNLATLDLIMC